MTKKATPPIPIDGQIDPTKLTDMGRVLFGGLQLMAAAQQVRRDALNSQQENHHLSRPIKKFVPFSDIEIIDWIKSHSYTNVKIARKAFMGEARAKGLAETFERVWRETMQRGRGRPPKNRS